MSYYDRNKRHFRGRYTKVKGKIKVHPNYIVGEENDSFLSMGITHSSKSNYTKKWDNYKMDPVDEMFVDKVVNKRKKIRLIRNTYILYFYLVPIESTHVVNSCE